MKINFNNLASILAQKKFELPFAIAMADSFFFDVNDFEFDSEFIDKGSPIMEVFINIMTETEPSKRLLGIYENLQMFNELHYSINDDEIYFSLYKDNFKHLVSLLNETKISDEIFINKIHKYSNNLDPQKIKYFAKNL